MLVRRRRRRRWETARTRTLTPKIFTYIALRHTGGWTQRTKLHQLEKYMFSLSAPRWVAVTGQHPSRAPLRRRFHPRPHLFEGGAHLGHDRRRILLHRRSQSARVRHDSMTRTAARRPILHPRRQLAFGLDVQLALHAASQAGQVRSSDVQRRPPPLHGASSPSDVDQIWPVWALSPRMKYQRLGCVTP